MKPTNVKLSKNGNAGIHGHAGQRGMYGTRGTNGVHGTHGQNADNIVIDLGVDEAAKSVNITGDFNYQLQLGNPNTQIAIEAQGGHGGNGGAGGNGGDGRDGSDGKDANKMFSGDNGENGQDGGPGGNGGNGGNGGDAGHVVINIDQKDTDLLMLINRPELAGGKGGIGGEAGKGGKGGKGGRGGSSYSWTETTYSTDSDGNTSSHTTHHSNSGGWNGLDGSPGRMGSAGSNGLDGKNGTYTIIVPGKGTYHDKYNLSVFDFAPIQSNDHIIEPNETVNIHQLTFENNGAMPTPESHPIQVYLHSNQWINFNTENTLTITQSINSRQITVLENPLQFTVKPAAHIPAIDETFHARASINFGAIMTRVNKGFQTVDQQIQTIDIRYPIEITPVSGTRTIARTEEAPIAIKIRNISSQPIGQYATSSRALFLTLQVTDGISGKLLQFYDKDGQTSVDFSTPIHKNFSVLRAYETDHFSGAIKFIDSNTPLYTKVKITYSLHLGKDIIQQRNFNLQLAEIYQFDSNADLLLVTNTSTTTKIVEQWKNVANLLKTSLSVWNTSLYQGLSYTKPRLQGNGSFMSQLQGKVIIILNNQFPTNQNQMTCATDYLDQMEILEAAQKANIATYVIGPNLDMKHTILPLNEVGVRSCSSVAEIITQIKAKPSQQLFYELPVNATTYFKSSPQQGKFYQAVAAAQKELERNFPDQGFVAVYKNDPQRLSKRILSSEWRLGTVQFRPTLSMIQARIAYRSQAQIKEPDDFDIYIVIKLLPFKHKLDLIEKTLSTQIEEILKEAILSDLIDELAAFGRRTWMRNFNTSTLRDGLKFFTQLGQYDFKNLTGNQAGVKFLQSLLIDYYYKAKSLPTSNDQLFFPNSKRRTVLKNLITTELKKLYPQYFQQTNFTNHNKNSVQQSTDVVSNKFSSNETEVSFDHKTSLTAVAQTTLPLYQRKQSSFIEGQNSFTSSDSREAAITSFTEDCKFEMGIPPTNFPCKLNK